MTYSMADFQRDFDAKADQREREAEMRTEIERLQKAHIQMQATIDRLGSKVKQLRAALKPFVKLATDYHAYRNSEISWIDFIIDHAWPTQAECELAAKCAGCEEQ